jgi:hypothetical protein
MPQLPISGLLARFGEFTLTSTASTRWNEKALRGMRYASKNRRA